MFAREYGMQAKLSFNRKRQLTKEAADEQAKKMAVAGPDEHQQLASTLKALSKRPLASKFDTSPAAARVSRRDGRQSSAVGVAQRNHRGCKKFSCPTFAKYLQQKARWQAGLAHGFHATAQRGAGPGGVHVHRKPGRLLVLRDAGERAESFLSSWRPCKTTPYARTMMRVTGRLSLNSTDPEDFLYTIRNQCQGVCGSGQTNAARRRREGPWRPLTATELEQQKKQAEELLFSGKETLGFAKALFFGQFNAGLVFPYPVLKAEESQVVDCGGPGGP